MCFSLSQFVVALIAQNAIEEASEELQEKMEGVEGEGGGTQGAAWSMFNWHVVACLFRQPTIVFFLSFFGIPQIFAQLIKKSNRS